jgi:hypothetical protein
MRYLTPMKPECIPAVALSLDRCVYCWYVVHPETTYPASWSSTCCPAHRARVLTHTARYKAARSSERAGNTNSGGVHNVTQPLMEGYP